jgi:hypothetical protein
MGLSFLKKSACHLPRMGEGASMGSSGAGWKTWGYVAISANFASLFFDIRLIFSAKLEI